MILILARTFWIQINGPYMMILSIPVPVKEYLNGTKKTTNPDIDNIAQVISPNTLTPDS